MNFFMRSSILCFFFLCFTTGLVSANQNQLFFEDFSEDLSQWQIAGSPTPAIVNSEGNPAPSFCTNDDLNYGGWAVSNNTFDYSNGLSISLDLKPGNASFPDQRYAVFRLLKDNTLYTLISLVQNKILIIRKSEVIAKNI